jgi:exopolyphosphatase/guanosine-5'-triphosphate,3'-diphosphate pyrophosphatase
VVDPGPRATAAARLAAAVDAALATTELPQRARAAGAALAASGGTASALASLDLGLAAYDPARVHGHVLEAAALSAVAPRLLAMATAEGAGVRGLDPARAAILPAGAVVLARIARATGAAMVRVSDRGVRHAYLCERLGLAVPECWA